MKSENVSVRTSKLHGQGVFANRSFNSGDTILLIDDTHVIQDESKVATEDKNHLDFLADEKIVLMQAPEVYINHSCDPNTYVKTIGGVRHLFAMKDISESDEITYDYAINGDFEMAAECKCGAKECRKVINSFWKLSKKRQLEYLPYLDDWFVEKYSDKIATLRQLVS